ncbi:hypothetical protein FGB62_106g05 [Gracilaria domingensis]|nr:hypothetical protein FGB62_106g05 [Gracilaria domingensis]
MQVFVNIAKLHAQDFYHGSIDEKHIMSDLSDHGGSLNLYLVDFTDSDVVTNVGRMKDILRWIEMIIRLLGNTSEQHNNCFRSNPSTGAMPTNNQRNYMSNLLLNALEAREDVSEGARRNLQTVLNIVSSHNMDESDLNYNHILELLSTAIESQIDFSWHIGWGQPGEPPTN